MTSINFNCEVCFNNEATKNGACDFCHYMASDAQSKISCPDCNGSGDQVNGKDCELCVGFGQMNKYDLHEWYRPMNCECSSWHSPNPGCRMHGVPADMREAHTKTHF